MVRQSCAGGGAQRTMWTRWWREGAIEVVVPLLSLFQPAEPSYREYVVTRCGPSPQVPPHMLPLGSFDLHLALATRHANRSIAQPTF